MKRHPMPHLNQIELAAPTAVDHVAEHLRHYVIDGHIFSGEYLRDVPMAAKLGVSRNTFRAAAQLLVRQGVLRQTTNRGFSVPTFAADDIVDATRFFAMHELEAIRTIVDSGDIPTRAIRISEQLRDAHADTPTSLLMRRDNEFHRAIVLASRSTRLLQSYKTVEFEIELMLVQYLQSLPITDEYASRHDHLIVCLEARNFEAASEEMLEYWECLRIRLLRAGARNKQSDSDLPGKFRTSRI